MASSNPRPLILLTNDDGVTAPGLLALAEAVRDLGDIVISAPAHEQSATSHAIHLRRPLKVRQLEDAPALTWAIEATPADCVKLCLLRLLENRRPDLTLAGINRGRNTGVNLYYSGTVAAAMESVICGIPAAAISLDRPDSESHPLHYEAAAAAARSLAQRILALGLPRDTMLNVNIPDRPAEALPGTRFARMSRSRYVDHFEQIPDHGDALVFENIGSVAQWDRSIENADDPLLEQGWIAITPLPLDRTPDPETLWSPAQWNEWLSMNV